VFFPMSTTPYPGPYPTTVAHILVHHMTAPAGSGDAVEPVGNVIRRRPTLQQGRSLETLGHAIEYLIDSQVYDETLAWSKNHADATQILMRLSREVFAECRQIVPMRERLRLRLEHLLAALHLA
jgi:phosphoribosyl 1,2-cyclic phosphodiesterase